MFDSKLPNICYIVKEEENIWRQWIMQVGFVILEIFISIKGDFYYLWYELDEVLKIVCKEVATMIYSWFIFLGPHFFNLYESSQNYSTKWNDYCEWSYELWIFFSSSFYYLYCQASFCCVSCVSVSVYFHFEYEDTYETRSMFQMCSVDSRVWMALFLC